jgi:hypothetical protein
MCYKTLTTNLIMKNQKKGRLTLEQNTQTQRNIYRKSSLNPKPYSFWDFDDLQTLHNYTQKKNKTLEHSTCFLVENLCTFLHSILPS